MFNPDMNVYLLFSYIPQAVSKRRLFNAKLLRRHPKLLYRAVSTRLISIIGKSDLVHVAIGFNGALLSITLTGTRFWPFDAYVVHAPTLSHAYVVPSDHWVDLDRYWSPGDKSPLSTILRYISRGRSRPTYNCVDTACAVLRQAEYEITNRITTPRQLDKWLKDKGFYRVDFR